MEGEAEVTRQERAGAAESGWGKKADAAAAFSVPFQIASSILLFWEPQLP